MELYQSIFTRASTTKFHEAQLSADTLKGLEKFIGGVQPLMPGVELEHQLVTMEDVKGFGIPKAPHFLLISGKEHPMRNICAGFLYQHAELYLYSKGYAARWLASVKNKHPDPGHIIGFAFGKPSGSASRKHEDFKRKPLDKIAEGTDSRLEAARLAPSGMNAQPWYFIVKDSCIHAYYKQSLGGLPGLIYRFTNLDLGLALCHLAVASSYEGKPFNFVTGRKDAPEAPKGYVYAGAVE